MVKFLATSPENLLQEIIAKGRAEGVTDSEGYNQLVQSVIEDHRRVGELHDDQALIDMVQALQERYPDYLSQAGLN